MAPGYPKVVDSATIKGLRPGFQAVVAGVCPSKQDARLIKDVLSLASGLAAALREVQVPATDFACPTLTSVDASSLPVAERVAVDNRFPDIRWVLRRRPINKECDTYALGVEVGKTLVYQESHRDEGCRANSSIIKRFKASIVKVGEVSYARVSGRVDWHDNGTYGESLMGLSCAGVHALMPLGNAEREVESITAAGDGSGRTRLRVRWGGSPLYGYPDGAETDYVRSADGCGFEEAKQGR
jgi:hypothetical protein